MVPVAERYTVIIDNNPSLRMWRDIVHEFMDEKIGVEYCRECYANREYPHRIYDGVVENDWIGLLVPEEYGGQGGDMIEQVILLEALGKITATISASRSLSRRFHTGTSSSMGPKNRNNGSFRSCSTARFGSQSASPNPAPEATPRVCRRELNGTATTTSSTARRCGSRPLTSTETSSTCTFEPIRTRRSTRGSARSSFRTTSTVSR